MDNLFVDPTTEGALIWNGGEDLQKDLDHFVKHPTTRPDLVDPLLNPFHHMMAVYGRRGMGKARGISEYCKAHNVRHVIVDVEFGKTVQAVELIDTHFENIAKNPPPVGTFDVLIIDHADLLIMNPDHEVTMQLMLELHAQASKHRCMVFACFDRKPLRETQSPVPENTKQFRSRAMAQFTVNFYYAYPTRTYRCDLIRSLLEEAQEKFPALKVELSETDYAHLETYSSFCSPQEIIRYVRTVLNAALSKDRVHPASKVIDSDFIHINLEVMRAPLSSATGSLHILRFDPKPEEDEYCRLCGKGTIPGATKKLAAPKIPLMKKEPAEKGLLEEEEEEVPRKRSRRQEKMEEEDERVLKALKGDDE